MRELRLGSTAGAVGSVVEGTTVSVVGSTVVSISTSASSLSDSDDSEVEVSFSVSVPVSLVDGK